MDIKEWTNGERGRASALAASIGVSPAFLSQMAGGGRSVPTRYCQAIKAATGGAVTCWDLRPADWHLIWPELIGAEGAPAVPQPATAAA